MDLIKIFLQTLKSIFKQIDILKTNDVSKMRQCLHIQLRLKALEKLADFFKKKKPEELSDDVNKAWEKLNKVLLKADELFDNILNGKTSDYKQEFDNLQESLTDAFVALSGALHVQEEKELQRQKIRLTEQEEKMFEQERKQAEQERKQAEQERKQAEQEKELAELREKLAEQERKQAEQEEKMFEQERKQAEQEKELAELREKLAEQEDMLHKLESKLSYRFNCTVQ